MPNVVHETTTTTATMSDKRFQPDLPHSEEPVGALNASEEPACASALCFNETQTELAHANQLAILEQLSASIAQAVQPIGATVTAAEAALRWLGHQPPDLEEARRMLAQIVEDSTRAADIVHRIRALVENTPSSKRLSHPNART
jgi:hypothetical protein